MWAVEQQALQRAAASKGGSSARDTDPLHVYRNVYTCQTCTAGQPGPSATESRVGRRITPTRLSLATSTGRTIPWLFTARHTLKSLSEFCPPTHSGFCLCCLPFGMHWSVEVFPPSLPYLTRPAHAVRLWPPTQGTQTKPELVGVKSQPVAPHHPLTSPRSQPRAKRA
jgi:hypothetical protein